MGDGSQASRPTRRVLLDLRNNGMTIELGEFCEACADGFASNLRASLPRMRRP